MKKYFILVLLVVVSACATANPAQQLPEITFGHKQKFNLNVRTIEVASEYRAPMAAPNVDHVFPTSPETAMRRWAADRLGATGVRGRARFTIRDGAAIEIILKQKEGLAGVFTTDQTENYKATAEVILEIFDDKGFRRAYATARVVRSRSIAEDATLNVRERLWFDLVDRLMKDFDTEMDNNIRQHIGGWIM